MGPMSNSEKRLFVPSVQLTERQLREVMSILDKHLLDYEIWVFGSRVNFTAREGSDLDLVLRNHQNPEIPIDLKQLAALNDDFEESELPFLVDVLDWALVSEKFREIVDRNKRLLRNSCDQQGELRCCDWDKAITTTS